METEREATVTSELSENIDNSDSDVCMVPTSLTNTHEISDEQPSSVDFSSGKTYHDNTKDGSGSLDMEIGQTEREPENDIDHNEDISDGLPGLALTQSYESVFNDANNIYNCLSRLDGQVRRICLSPNLKLTVENPLDIVFSGDIAGFHALLEIGVDINMPIKAESTSEHYIECCTLLAAALAIQNEELVQLLLENGADANIPNEINVGNLKVSSTPLSMAIIHQNKKLVQMLLQYADVNIMAQEIFHAAGEYLQRSHLLIAAVTKNKEIIELLLEHGAEINKEMLINENRYRILMTVVIQGNTELVKLLLEYGAQVNFQASHGGRTALMAAVDGGHYEVAHILLQHGAIVDLETEIISLQNTKQSLTALMIAAVKGSIDLIKLLLEHGAQVNFQASHGGGTALMAAIAGGQCQAANLLLEHGAKVDLEIQISPPKIITKLVKSQNVEIAKYAIQMMRCFLHGQQQATVTFHEGWSKALADIESKFAENTLKHGITVDMETEIDIKYSHTALILAAVLGHTDLIKLLLEFGAQVNFQASHGGHTALMIAMAVGHYDAGRILLEYGAKVDTEIDIIVKGIKCSSTILIFAAVIGDIEMIKFLLEYGAQVNFQTSEGCTALIVASFLGCSEVVKLLLEHTAEVNLQDSNGLIALMVTQNTEVTKLLLEYGAQVDLQSSHGFNALMVQSEDGCCEVARVLIEHCAEVDLQDSEGWSALMYAVHNNKIDIVQLLLINHADVKVRNRDGEDALHLAREHEFTDIENLLTKRVRVGYESSRAIVKKRTTRTTPTDTVTISMMRTIIAQQQLFTNAFQQIVDAQQQHTQRMDNFEALLKQSFQAQAQATTLTTPPINLSTRDNPVRQQDSERPELADAHKILKQIASEWENIGMYLGLPEDEIKSIKREQQNISKDCLRELLSLWLKRVNPPPTWQALAEAVREVDEQAAKQIEDTHIRK